MDFRNINLPGFLLADLYKNDLVLVNNDTGFKATTAAVDDTVLPVAATETGAVEQEIAFLGKNNRQISILVKDEQAIHLQDDLLDILSAILSACKLNLADVAIINLHQQRTDDRTVRRQFSPRVVLLFGIQTTEVDLPFSIPQYKPQSFDNCTYVQAASLEQLRGTSNEAKLEKSKLWICLKNVFGI